MKHVLVLAAALVTLAGCGGSPAPEQRASAPQTQPKAAPKRELVFQPLVDDLETAKGVQKTVDDQAAEQRRQIDEIAR